METKVDHYVESVVSGIYGDSPFVEEIDSRIDFIERNMNTFKNGFYIDGFRFYDIETIYLNGKKYVGEPCNYSQWINRHYFDEDNRVAVLSDDSISVEDYLKKLKDEEHELKLKK
jgi:hypothetical protein